MHDKRDELLKKLTMLDFMATDLALYLNTHPNELDALDHYNSIVKQAHVVRALFENEFGPLCGARTAYSINGICWRDEPWPWNCEANFTLL